MTRPGRRRIMIVDDHEMVAAPLADMLRRVGYDVPAPVPAVERVPDPPGFDLVLCDLLLAGRSGAAAISHLVGRGHRVLAMSGVAERPEVLAVFAAGARGFVDKTDRPDALLNAVHLVLTEEYFLCPRLAGYLLDDVTRRPLRREDLTGEQSALLEGLARGDRLGEYAERARIGPAAAAALLAGVRGVAARRESRYRPSDRELEVLRLVGCQGLKQEAAARKMRVSANWVTGLLTEIKRKYVALHPEAEPFKPSMTAALWARELGLCPGEPLADDHPHRRLRKI